MATLPNMNIVLPTLGQDIGQWDDKLNAALTLVDAHDHTSGKGPRVPTAGININADLAFGGFGPTGLGKAAFNAVTALASGSKTLFVSSADNELYWRTNGGTNVKLTSGTSINITLVGGIVGDYSSVGAEVAYDDANKRYTFKQQGSPKPWARIATGPVRIYEYNTTETVYVELAVAAALAASYTLTFPAALPGAAALAQISAAGLVTFPTSPTAADYKYTSTQIITIPASAAISTVGAPHALDPTTGAIWTIGNSTGRLVYPVEVRHLDRIVGWRLYVDKASVAGTVTARLYRYSITAGIGAEVALGTAATSTSTSGTIGALSNSGLSIDVDTGVHNQYYVAFTGGGTVGDNVYNLEIDIQRP